MPLARDAGSLPPKDRHAGSHSSLPHVAFDVLDRRLWQQPAQRVWRVVVWRVVHDQHRLRRRGGYRGPGRSFEQGRRPRPVGRGAERLPLPVRRPSREGEISTFPQIWIDGSAVPTQADVKQRWPDGSVRHAILSVVIPTLPAGQDVGLEFGVQATGNNTALTTAEMLDPAFDFDARIDIASGGTTAGASARQMLTDGKAVAWTSGPIATTVILADHGPTRAYDLGFDTYRPIRPIFEATFWPQTHTVRVRFIGENANTTTLEDVAYDLTLSLGASQPKQIYSRTGLAHYFGTRWTQVAWAPAAPEPDVSVDSGLAYLETTQFFPNFDVSQAIPASLLGNNATAWAGAPKDLYDPGLWTLYMPTTGGRADVGPYPGWTTAWLRTGDPGARAIAFGQADLAAAWPLHWREGDATTKFDRKQTIPGIGLPRSINAHPTLWFPDNNGVYAPILPTPRIANPNIYPTTFGGWAPDGAHQPDPFSPQYILSGDHFYLEEMQLWAAAQAFTYTPGGYGRGVDGYAGVQDQIRGNGWVLRSRVNAAFLSPDGSPEKTYFNELVEDALALWEGQRDHPGHPARVPPGVDLWARPDPASDLAAPLLLRVGDPDRPHRRLRPGHHEGLDVRGALDGLLLPHRARHRQGARVPRGRPLHLVRAPPERPVRGSRLRSSPVPRVPHPGRRRADEVPRDVGGRGAGVRGLDEQHGRDLLCAAQRLLWSARVRRRRDDARGGGRRRGLDLAVQQRPRDVPDRLSRRLVHVEPRAPRRGYARASASRPVTGRHGGEREPRRGARPGEPPPPPAHARSPRREVGRAGRQQMTPARWAW